MSRACRASCPARSRTQVGKARRSRGAGLFPARFPAAGAGAGVAACRGYFVESGAPDAGPDRGPDAAVEFLPAHFEGRSGRGADRLAPADAARRDDPPGQRRHLFLAAARLPGAASNVERIVREEQDRAGCQEMLMPTIQSADLWRESGRYDDYGKEMLRIRGPSRPRHAVRADQRGTDHRNLQTLH